MFKNSITIPEFCNRESISRAMFYKLHKQGLAPKIMKIGRLTRISIESVAEWRKRMEKLATEK